MKKFALSKITSSLRAGAYVTSMATVALINNTAIAQETDEQEVGLETIQVTATRRSGTVQEVPLNITALGDDVIKEQNIFNLSDVARWVPGLSVQDQGGRSSSPIIVRGLNTNSSGPSSDGGTVATYLGEIPLFVDFRLIDFERVEVLIGPQGTLYGAGSLGGAIRYIPNKPETDLTTVEVKGDIFKISESGSIGEEASIIFNTPLIEDKLGLRVAINSFSDPGFIDYNYQVQTGGVSLPDPDWNDPSAVSSNLQRAEDQNGEDTLTTKIALRWTPTDNFEATLSYYAQDQEVAGRSITHFGSLGASNPLRPLVGQYESAYRYPEPRDKKDELISLEMTADLGFAELTSASGWSKFEAVGQRDQTDLLIRLDYGYELFPAFSAFTREEDNVDNFTQEVRLVSTGDSKLSWIVGAYYNKEEDTGDSREFTPGFDQFAVDNFGGVQLRPDALEYLSVGDTETTEKAIFGEISYEITDEWIVTVGTRFFEYEVVSDSAVDLPLLRTVFSGDAPDSIILELDRTEAKDDDSLLKFNTSYQITKDFMAYFTLSDGFRIGGANGVALCPDFIDETTQIVCALPDEVLYQADTTTNMELGFKSSWLNNNLILNGALFDVEWKDAQVSGATVNGQQPITVNAQGAEASGVELSARAMLNDYVTAYATYSYTKAELTADAPFLFRVIDPSDVPEGISPTAVQDYYDGKNGDRLPGSPETQISFGLSYGTEVLGDKYLDIAYGLTYQSDIITKVGLRADGETISGYSIHNLSAKLSGESWAVTLYADNLFDKYAFTNTRRDAGDIGLANFSYLNSNDPALQRNYGHFVLQPRKIGIRFEYLFEI